MQKNPLISIIVPIYGTEKYLSACIDSIIQQSYTNLEIILVDDQSPDSCPTICDSYSKNDKRIIVIHQENKGVCGARNAGLERATGEFVMFVDSDDEIMPDAVRILLQDAMKYEADIVSGAHRMVDSRTMDTVTDECDKIMVYGDDTSLLLSLRGAYHTDSVWAKLFRSIFIQDVRFEEGMNINEDGWFMFLCFLRRPLYVQHDVIVYCYYIRKESNSRQLFSDKYLSMMYYCERKKELVAASYPQYMDEAKNMEVRVCLQLLDLLCSTTEKKYKKLEKECIATIRKLLKYHKPINKHHKLVVSIVRMGIYPLYKMAVRMKYYR